MQAQPEDDEGDTTNMQFLRSGFIAYLQNKNAVCIVLYIKYNNVVCILSYAQSCDLS